MPTAAGPFDVKLTPATLSAEEQQAGLGRMSLDKQFHGDLDAHSIGEMVMAGTAVKGSAGYVAIERVTGRLGARSGSFLLQHHGIMNRGAGQLTITVVPDSGTDDLVGLTGSMTIDIRDGQHVYRFDYTLEP
jgi:hypothetical protein